MRWRTFPVTLLLAAACIPDPGPMMRPGEDCLECHGGGGGGGGRGDLLGLGGGEDDARPWSAAGTVYPSANADAGAGLLNAHIDIVDANGWHIRLRTNAAGNFYTAEKIAFPLTVSVEKDGVVNQMPGTVSYGGCNGCHEPGNRIHVP